MSLPPLPSLPLFTRVPGLVKLVPWMPLGAFPTPVQRLERLGAALGCRELWIKRDDLTGTAHGGNKVRKLEFLLAEARQRGDGRVFVYGATGSNWVVAALHYAKELGLGRDVMLFRSPSHPHADRNLAAIRGLADTLVERRWPASVPFDVFRHALRRGTRVLPKGGTNALSTLGYLNAGLELAEQVRAGELPEPDYVFVPLGTCGTAAGLLAGLHLAGLRTRLVAVRITSRFVANAARVWGLAAWALTTVLRGGVQAAPMRREQFEVDTRHLGAGYGLPTPEAEEATRRMRELEGIDLDPSYTAKTVAALTDAVRERGLGDQRVLYWLTLNSAPLAASSR